MVKIYVRDQIQPANIPRIFSLIISNYCCLAFSANFPRQYIKGKGLTIQTRAENTFSDVSTLFLLYSHQ